jgi:hypothetical protein
MATSLSQAAPASHRIPASRRITAEDRMERIGQLTAKQQTDALLWLAGYAPTVFDAVAEAVEPCPGDSTEDPAPYCAICGSDIGIFLKFGLAWRHYTGTDLSDIELLDPGHQPVLAWRTPGLPA